MFRYIVIDDEELIRKGTIKKLSRMDQIVCIGEADNGKSGIALVQELNPDFVILDMQMPEMDGMSLLPWLAEHYPAMPLIVISGYRDFDYIKQAISSNAVEYLLKPFSRDAIQQCVQQAIARLSARSKVESQILSNQQQKEQARYDYDIQLLTNLILGYHVSSIQLTSEKLSFINDTHDLMLMTLHFENLPPDQPIQEWMEEQGFGDLALYLSSPHNPNLGYIILFMPPNRSLSSTKLVNQILDVLIPWASAQQCTVRAGISGIHSDLSELSTVYEETCQALNQQPLGKPADRFFYRGEATPRQLHWEKMEEFLFRIDAGMEPQVQELTRELFQWYAKQPECTLMDVKFHCYMLSDQCRQILNQYSRGSKSAESSGSMQNIVNHLFSLGELEQYYVRYFTNLAAMIRPHTVYSIDDTIQRIQIYIQRNYQKNLSQEFISYLFSLNRSYLSTLFKEKTGKKFADYLNEVRIEKSKELLLNSRQKLFYVARAVGYDNVKYYFRVFKKYTGLTPEQYRQKYTQK